MQIQPVNFNHTSFNGAVQVKNLTNGVTKDYKISHELDKKLITAYKNNLAADPFTNGMQVFEKDSFAKGIKAYLNTLSEVTGDNFVKELPQSEVKTDKFSSKLANDAFSELTTEHFKITHNVNA